MKYGDVARGLMGSVAGIADKLFGGISAALGYYGARFPTTYPTTYLEGSVQFGSQTLLNAPSAVTAGMTPGEELFKMLPEG